MKIIISVLTAIIPSLFLLRYFYKRDLHPEPRLILLWTFILGFLAIIPVLIFAWPLSLTAPKSNPIYIGFYWAFFGAAIPEEFFKFLVIVFFCARKSEFDEPMDGIIYGVTASLGFATVENIVYVLQGGWSVALIRAFSAVPFHACMGAILGYFVAQSKFCSHKKITMLRGLFITIIIHGLYDFPLISIMVMNNQAIKFNTEFSESQMRVGLFISFTIIFVLTIIQTLRIVRRVQNEQLICHNDKT